MQSDSITAPRGFRSGPYNYHEEAIINISNLTNTGQGVGRDEKNWVILIPFCIPGEKVKARIYRNHKNHSEADLIEVIDVSPSRISAECSKFGVCGGCQYQHIKYEDQLKWKKQQVSELLKHMAGIELPVNDVIPSPKHYGYRSKITPHFNKPKQRELGPIGFQQYGRRALIDIDHCPIAKDDINQQLPLIRNEIIKKTNDYKKGATILMRSDYLNKFHTESKSIAKEKVGDLYFDFPAGSFFQNNPFILKEFTEHVKYEAKCVNSKYLVDAYCGAGLFALTSASNFDEVTGIEISEESINWANKNRSINNLKNVIFHSGRIENIFSGVRYNGNETSVIIDPPRKGCSEDFLSQLFDFSPNKVVYVSCNPATQMRDLKLFIKNEYRLVRIQPFDLFPQTRHLECVMTLEKI